MGLGTLTLTDISGLGIESNLSNKYLKQENLRPSELYHQMEAIGCEVVSKRIVNEIVAGNSQGSG
jgi:hypothetical protein